MGNEELQLHKNGQLERRKTSSQESVTSLAAELHLAALNAKSEPEAVLVQEFTRAFMDHPPAAIQFAFREWRRMSDYFPTVRGIQELLDMWHRNQAQDEADRQRAKEQAEANAARAKGELVDFAELAKTFKSLPETPEARHIREIGERAKMANVAAPPLRLTPEEIDQRRFREQAEIEQYRRRGEA